MGNYINKIFGAPAGQQDQAIEDAHRLYFFKKLQAVTNKIHATGNVQEIILGLSADICDLFSCDRLTLYAVSEGRTSIETLVKTGLNTFKDFSLPISDKSVAGYVALTKKLVNVGDVYDETELKSYSPSFHFLQKVDKRTGYRTREMLVVPIISEQRELLGVLQLINNRNGGNFSKLEEEGAQDLAKTLAIAFAQRMKPALVIKTKYDPLVVAGVISTPELELASRSARRKGQDLETVLINDFQIRVEDIGTSLSDFFEVPYEAYMPNRSLPKIAIQRFKREYVESNQWLVLEDNDAHVKVMAVDPDRIRASKVVNSIYPDAEVAYFVTTLREFKQTVEQFYGVPSHGQAEAPLSGTLAQETKIEREMLDRVGMIIVEAFGHEATDIQISLDPDLQRAHTEKSADGRPESVSGHVVVNFRFNY